MVILELEAAKTIKEIDSEMSQVGFALGKISPVSVVVSFLVYSSYL